MSVYVVLNHRFGVVGEGIVKRDRPHAGGNVETCHIRVEEYYRLWVLELPQACEYVRAPCGDLTELGLCSRVGV